MTRSVARTHPRASTANVDVANTPNGCTAVSGFADPSEARRVGSERNQNVKFENWKYIIEICLHGTTWKVDGDPSGVVIFL